MIHERLDLAAWTKRFPLSGMDKHRDVATALTGPLPIAYVEQIRAEAIASGVDLGDPVPVDVCVWNLGDSERREVTKVGGVPYWPADAPWPMVRKKVPYTFVAQFCFADSRDVLPELPGDVLSILAADESCQELALHWFPLGIDKLLPAKKVPAPQWEIPPCHAALHRTAEYPGANYEDFEKIPYPLCLWARRFVDGSKIGGTWQARGEAVDLDAYTDEELAAAGLERTSDSDDSIAKEEFFLCQLGAIQATFRQPYLNESDLESLHIPRPHKFLMVGDVGGLDFFFDGEYLQYEFWCG